MTKVEIAERVHERVGLSKKESGQMVDLILESIRQQLAQGDDVKLSGFGHFTVRGKSARRGRNPKTGEEIMVTPRQVVTFRASQSLKQKLTDAIEDSAT
ncbi:MAG: integration host factor subunit alpha [Mariprofundaceae bacterium]